MPLGQAEVSAVRGVDCRELRVLRCNLASSAPNCLSCNEAFAGAPQRKAQMERERMQGQHAQQASVWGGVAASFLGAAAGSVIGEALSSHDGCSSYSTCSTDDVDDVSDVSDDTGFDFGDDD